MFLDFLSTFPVDSLKRFWLRIFIIFSLYSEFCNSEFSSIFFSIFFVSLLKDCDHKTFLWKFSLNSGLWDSKFSLVSFLFFNFLLWHSDESQHSEHKIFFALLRLLWIPILVIPNSNIRKCYNFSHFPFLVKISKLTENFRKLESWNLKVDLIAELIKSYYVDSVIIKRTYTKFIFSYT